MRACHDAPRGDCCDPLTGECEHQVKVQSCSAQLGDGIACVEHSTVLQGSVCNTGSCPATFSWQIQKIEGDPAVSFSPSSGTAMLDPQECHDFTVPVTIEAGRAGDDAVLELTAQTASEGPCASEEPQVCSDTGTVTVQGLTVIPLRTQQPAEVVYLLPNDREEFRIVPVTSGNVYVIREPSIAKFAASDTELTSWIPAQEPFTLHGLAEGETELQERVGSPSGPLVCTIPVKVGGTVTLEFDQLPTYTPGTALLYLAKDYQLGDLFVPNETKAALEEKGNAVMSYWVIVRDADGRPMYNKQVALIQVRHDEFPDTNLMNIQYDAGDYSADERGVVKGTVRLHDMGLDIDVPHWKLIVLVGDAAQEWHQGGLPVQELDEVFQRQVDPDLLENRVFNGHLIRIKREDFPELGGTIETGMALSLPHVSSNYYGIFRDFFEHYLGRQAIVAQDTNGTALPAEQYWRIFDAETPTDQPVLIENEWWLPPAQREFNLLPQPRFLPLALGEYPQDDVSILIYGLYAGQGIPSRYFPEFPGDEAVGQDGSPAALLARAILSEIALGLIPIYGDGRDILDQISNM